MQYMQYMQLAKCKNKVICY